MAREGGPSTTSCGAALVQSVGAQDFEHVRRTANPPAGTANPLSVTKCRPMKATRATNGVTPADRPSNEASTLLSAGMRGPLETLRSFSAMLSVAWPARRGRTLTRILTCCPGALSTSISRSMAKWLNRPVRMRQRSDAAYPVNTLAARIVSLRSASTPMIRAASSARGCCRSASGCPRARNRRSLLRRKGVTHASRSVGHFQSLVAQIDLLRWGLDSKLCYYN